MCFVANKVRGLYVYEPTTMEACLAGSKPTSDLEMWHMRMGHLNVQDLKILPNLSEGIKITSTIPMDLCSACVKAKMHETSYENKGLNVEYRFVLHPP